MKSSRIIFKIFVIITEFIIINLVCKLAYFYRLPNDGNLADNYLSFFLIFNLAWIGASLFNNAYDTKQLSEVKSFTRSLISTLFIHIFIIAVFLVGSKTVWISREFLIAAYVGTAVLITAFRGILIMAYRYYNNMTYNIRKIAVLGAEESMTDLYNFFDSKNTTVFRFLEHVDEDLSKEERHELIRQTVEEVKAFCLEEEINEIYMSMNLVSGDLIEELSDFADDNFVYFRIVTNFDVLGGRPVNVDFFGHIPILSLRTEPLKVMLNRILKRSFDIAFSFGVILFVFPILMPIVALLIKLESEGPVFFKQLRTGKNGKDFWCYKFRTMTVNSDSDAKQATKGDKRITKIGSILRKTSLDEFPQFINVFMGHMSVVGPRPHMLKH
ncbi:MAG: sugar transferase, partial [Bacteroidota bacterium]